jgi:hypothetical protein
MAVVDAVFSIFRRGGASHGQQAGGLGKERALGRRSCAGEIPR